MRRTPDRPDRPACRAPVRRVVAGTAVALAAALVGGAASARLSEEPPSETEAMLREQIDGLIAAGLPEDHPKVASLREDLRAMERSEADAVPAEPGIDLGAVVDAAREGVAAERGAAGAWDSGEIVCEPVPGLLSVDDVADAVCFGVPQPDGTSRYVAIGRDQVAHVVAFGSDGAVGRSADRPVPAPVVPGETTVVPTPQGDLQITPPGRPPVVAEVP